MATLPEQILKWSTKRPAWQRDALRRLFSTGALADSDLKELVDICKATNKALADGQVAPSEVPLDRSHIAAVGSSLHPVSLTTIKDVKGVNALGGKVPLLFASPGLTAIYGDNGIGKSGYARILKRICRARGGQAKILPNIFAPATSEEQQATVGYCEGTETYDFDWRPGVVSPEALGAVSVFDSQTATIYVEDPNDIAFRPHGLDVFPKLVRACDSIRASLQGEINALGAERVFADLQGENAVGHAIRALPAAQAIVALRELANMSDTEKSRLSELTQVVRELDANAGDKRAREIRLRVSRYTDLAKRIARIGHAIDDAALTSLRTVVTTCESAAQVAKLAREALFAEQPGWAIGGEPWRALWEAARRYATTVVYPDHDHPFTGEGAQCVLCQQRLTTDAATRLRHFEEFVKNDTAKAEATARTVRDLAVNTLRVMAIAAEGDDTLLAELAADDAPLATDCAAYLQQATVRRNALVASASSPTWNAIPPHGTDVAPRITALNAKLEAQAKELVEALGSAKARLLREEHGLLKARASLATSMAAVEAEHVRRQRIAALKKCIQETDTAKITSKNTDLTKAGVSEELRGRFQLEMDQLALDHLTVSVEPQYGAKGVTYHQVSFSSATNGDWAIRDVLSEGEHRCIALAGFLAELASQKPPSAVMFDDPVSSLDHVRREVVATRLVSEARTRQVIILTHDLVFLLLLQEECKSQGIAFNASVLTKEKGEIGVPREGLPWYGMPLKKRIGWMRQQLVELKKAEKVLTAGALEGQMTNLWGRLREGWECAVEEVLLNGAIKRFSRKVSTEPLKKITDISAEDVATIDAAMTQCSKWLPGHDQAPALNTPMPGFAKLEAAVEALESWRSAVEKRREHRTASSSEAAGVVRLHSRRSH